MKSLFCDLCIFLLSALAFDAMAQIPPKKESFTLSGFIEDAGTKERLPGATVPYLNSPGGTTSNQYGFFSLTRSKQQNTEIEISFVCYHPLVFGYKFEKDSEHWMRQLQLLFYSQGNVYKKERTGTSMIRHVWGK